jgi:hypothetical protein
MAGSSDGFGTNKPLVGQQLEKQKELEPNIVFHHSFTKNLLRGGEIVLTNEAEQINSTNNKSQKNEEKV